MVYSVKTHNQFKRVAEQLGYSFVSLVDELPPKESVKKYEGLWNNRPIPRFP